MDIVSALSLGLNAGAAIVGVVLFLTKSQRASATTDATHGTRLDAQGRELGEIKKRLEAMEADSHLVVRLEERITAMSTQLEQTPKIIGAAVQEGIRAALSAVLTGARKSA